MQHTMQKIILLLSIFVLFSSINISAVKWLMMINHIQNKSFVYIIYVCVLCIFIIRTHACIYFREILFLYIKCIYL